MALSDEPPGRAPSADLLASLSGMKKYFEFGYSTTKSVRIYSWKIGLVYYLLSLIITTYVGLYVMWWQRGYQIEDAVSGTVVTKIKGTAADPNNTHPLYAARVWDASDLVEYTANGFFVATSMLVTEQRQGFCTAGNHSSDQKVSGLWSESCAGGSGCEEGVMTFNGRQTGLCITDGSSKTLSDRSKAGLIGVCTGGEQDGEACYGEDDLVTCGPGGVCYGAYCEVQSWCPIELSTPNCSSLVQFHGWEDWSVFARIDVMFSKFNLRHNNVADHSSTLCTLEAAERGDCPAPNQFTLQQMLSRAGVSVEDALETGAEIMVTTVWADTRPFLGSSGEYPCDLDSGNWRENCQPHLTFRRLDDADPHAFSHGYNYRIGKTSGGTEEGAARELRKLTGLKVLFEVEGQGGRFDAVQTGTTLGSGLALLSLAAVVADFIILYMGSRDARQHYYRHKYEQQAPLARGEGGGEGGDGRIPPTVLRICYGMSGTELLRLRSPYIVLNTCVGWVGMCGAGERAEANEEGERADDPLLR